MKTCSITGCKRKFVAKGMCMFHWQRDKYGRPAWNAKEQFILDNPPKNGIGLIPVGHGKVATVDAEDWERLSKEFWYINKMGYAVRVEKKGGVSWVRWLHREVLPVPEGKCCDHIDHDPLNCRKTNLRLATFQENCRNRNKHRDGKSRFKGVCLNVGNRKWQASICLSGKQCNLGYFADEEDAALAYDAAARFIFGEFALTNGI